MKRFNGLELGDIVHYDPYGNGSQLVRCRVIEFDGFKYLRPIALVGQWFASDLPHRDVDGSIACCSFAEMILKQDGLLYPPEAALCENTEKSINPKDWPELDLTIREMSEVERQEKILMNAINGCRIIATPSDLLDTKGPDNLKCILEGIISRAQRGLKEAGFTA